DVAAHIKETFESRFGPTWHCVVGKSFGSRVSYEQQHFILLKINRTSVMIFKCGY
uniref:Dynein light chain n=1 Tax=Steinernema glaseri TaxID=37863 RepID=A0A1I8ABC1_9BILA